MVRAVADVTKGGARAILPKSIKVERIMGQGSFGEVFQGQWTTPAGEHRVVLKRVKARVEGAAEMGQMELLLNAYASKVARSHCADFIGYCEVAPDEATPRLTSGLWLMWRYEGSRTLAYYLRRRDTLRALASDLEIQEEAVVPTVMKQLFECLAAFHAAGLVHRDVKPLNIIFAEDHKRIKLIDLGACADLRTGTNYVPDESILDPNYCPPEQYVLPTDSPHLAKSMFKVAISPMLWAQHKPDRFDTWSAGVTLLQLAIPSMRQDRFLKNFNTQYGPKFDYDLDAWRANSFIPARDFDLLDADGGAGWDMAKALLRPRSIKNMPDGTVAFVNDSQQPRISAGEALKHRYMRQAREPGSIFDEAPASSSLTGSRGGSGGQKSGSGGGQKSGSGGQKSAAGTGSKPGSAQKGQPALAADGGAKAASKADNFGAAVGLWRNLTNKLFDLEANIMVTASATEKQSTVVKKLQAKAVKGAVDPSVLKQEEKKLNKMEGKLSSLQDDFNSTASAVTNVLGFLGFGPSSSKSASGGQGKGATTGDSKGSSAQSKAAGRAPVLSTSSAAPKRTTTPSSQQAGGVDANSRVWKQLQARMQELELKLMNQASATEKQSFTVKKLRQAVRSGQVDEEALRRAEALLERMEKRLKALDRDVKSTKQEATGLLGLLGLSSTSKPAAAAPSAPADSPRSKQPAPSAADVAAAEAAKALNVKQPAQGGGFGGFFSRMFGGSASPTTSGASTPVAVSPPASPKKAPAPAPVPPPATASFSAASGDSMEEAGGTEARSLQRDLTEGANALVVNSIKFTGMAAKVALGMAVAMRADAERALKEMEVEADKRRKAKLAEQAFMRMLGAKTPAMEVGTSFDEVQAAFGSDPRYLAVEEAQRPLLVAAYIDALYQAQLRTEAAAEAKLKDMYRQIANLDTRWDEVQSQFEGKPEFLAVEDGVRRVTLFEEVLSELKEEADGRAAVGRNEEAFRQLLQQLDAPPLSPSSSWPLVKPQVWKDARYLAVPESRRRDIFTEVMADVTAAAAARAEQQKATAAAQAEAVAEILRDATGKEDGGLIDDLRKEQARLRSEYDKMEAKLREMEAALAAKERAGSRSPTPGPSFPAFPGMPAASGAAAPSSNGSKGAANGGTGISASPASIVSPTPARRAPTPVPNAVANGARTGTPVAETGSVRVRRVGRLVTPAGQRGNGDAAGDAGMADTLKSAGVMFTKLDDGTLVFSFDTPSPSPSKSVEQEDAVVKQAANISNGRAN